MSHHYLCIIMYCFQMFKLYIEFCMYCRSAHSVGEGSMSSLIWWGVWYTGSELWLTNIQKGGIDRGADEVLLIMDCCLVSRETDEYLPLLIQAYKPPWCSCFCLLLAAVFLIKVVWLKSNLNYFANYMLLF